MEKSEKSSAPAPSSSASGGKEKIEKQARQLAYDVRYKVKQSMSANKGGKLDPAAVRKAYISQLGKSTGSPPVKARAKEMLLGEDYINVKEFASDTVASIVKSVFTEKLDPVGKEDSDVDNDGKKNTKSDKYIKNKREKIGKAIDSSGDKKFKVRVTDKGTGNTYVRMATRAKIAELRANSNISSVEITGHGEPSSSKAEEYLKGELLEKKSKDGEEKKITGKGVNNKKLIKVFPNSVTEQAEPEKDDNKEKTDKVLASKEKKLNIIKKQVLLKKMQAVRQGGGEDIVAHNEPELELTEEYINESIEHATDYFYKQGLNPEGVDIVIEDLGIDEFTDFVLNGLQTLNEERDAKKAPKRDYEKVKAAVYKKDAERKSKGTGEYSKTKAAKDKYGDKPAPEGKPEKKKVEKSVEKAKKEQPAKPTSKSGIGDRIRSAVKKGVERHKAATKKASGEVKKIAKTASDTAKKHSQHRKDFVKGISPTKKEKKIAKGVGGAVKKALTREELEVAEAKVDTVKKLDDEGKEDARNYRKYGTKHNQFGQAVRRRGEHRSERGVKKIKGEKPAPKGAYGEEVELVDEAQSSYDKARKAAARRAADRNAKRRRGEMGGRMERETYTNEAGTRMHHKGYRARENEEVEVKGDLVDEKFATQYKDKSKLGQSSQRKSLGRGASIKDGAKASGYESKKEHRDTSKKLAKYQTKGTYNAHLEAYTVTTADQKGNTPAWQGYKKGKKNVKTGEPLYKKGDDVKEAKKKEEEQEDPRSMGTKYRNIKNRLRSLGIKFAGPTLDELNRYGKETGKATGSLNKRPGTPVKKGGDEPGALRNVRGMIRKETGKPEGQKRRDHDARHKGQDRPETPKQTVTKRREAKARADAAMRDTSGT